MSVGMLRHYPSRSVFLSVMVDNKIYDASFEFFASGYKKIEPVHFHALRPYEMLAK